jgi:DNA-binding NarL/FixJ family response regulator
MRAMRTTRIRLLDLRDGEPTMPAPRPIATTTAVAVVGDDRELVFRVRAALRREALAASVEHGGRVRLDVDALERRPDVLVLGAVELDRAIAEVHAVRRRLRAVRVVLVVPPGVAGQARHVLGAGIDGIVLEPELERTLALAVRSALAGQLTMPEAMRHGLEPPALSQREREIVGLVVDGRTNAEIAARLYLSKSTVAGHLTAIFRRLDVRSRDELVGLVRGADESVRRLLIGADVPGDDEPERGR